MAQRTFSKKLESWLRGQGTKTFADLDEKFGPGSFAVAFLLLMSLAALPIPTGGITHIFEIITLLISLGLIAGRSSIWLPRRWRKLKLSGVLQKKALPKFLGVIRWFEKFSRPRFPRLFKTITGRRVIGMVVFILTLAALVAPPFSGLDTLPALGVVIVSLSLLLEDAALFVAGCATGAIGIGLEISLGSLALHLLR